MAVEGDLSLDGLRYLLNCRAECEHLDYKSKISFEDDHSAIELVKDLVAMKNIGGGYLIVGVEDKTWKPIGIGSSTELDSKLLKDKVRKYSGLELDVNIVERIVDIDGGNKLFAMICVRTSPKANKLKNPSSFKKSYCESENWGVRNGEYYIRVGDETCRLVDLEGFYSKLEDLQDRYQEAEQSEATNAPSPFEVEIGFYRLLPKEYMTFVGREELLETVKSALCKDPRLWIVNLYGPGGVGKSALATRIAYEYFESAKVEAILHLSAKDRELSIKSGIRPLIPSLISLEDLIDRILTLFSHQEMCTRDLQYKKSLVIELLNAFSMLLILDNMEAVDDGRIMEFVREFPPETKAKVLLTSRQRSGAWEMPIQVTELSLAETKEFIELRSRELQLDFPYNNDLVIRKINQITGGLPLAIQWILGDYARTRDINVILERVITNQSPLLEFSFRNSWNTLDIDAQQALAVLPIFNQPPTLQEWRTILNWTIDKVDKAKTKLIESTFVTERTDQKTGNKIYIALPITLSFARLELDKFGQLGIDAQARYDSYNQRILLSKQQISRSEDLFYKFEASTENQRKAILLSRMAEGQMSSLGYEEAEEYYKQALQIDPFSIFTLVSYARLKAEMMEFQTAIELINRALAKITKRSAFYVYYNLADIYGRIKDWNLKIKYLQEALKYEEPSPYLYTMAQHSLGVALGKTGRHYDAIRNFDEIIVREMNKEEGPGNSLVVAARTKKISLERTDQNSSKEFLDKLINDCRRFTGIDHIIAELIHIRDKE